MRYLIPVFILVVGTIISIMGFRGDLTESTPIEVFPDMDRQAKFKSQTANTFFDNTSSDRLPVEGTAIRGNLISIRNVFSEKPEFESDDIKFGKNSDSQWVSKIPNEVGIDMSLMRLGKEKYDIHCSICHGEYGDGKGPTAYFGLAPRNLSDASIPGYLESAAPWTDGQIYNAISNGSASGIMLGLKEKLSPRERWGIVLYLRALQNYVNEVSTQTEKDS